MTASRMTDGRPTATPTGADPDTSAARLWSAMDALRRPYGRPLPIPDGLCAPAIATLLDLAREAPPVIARRARAALEAEYGPDAIELMQEIATERAAASNRPAAAASNVLPLRGA